MTVAVGSLVEASEIAQVGPGTFSGDGSARHSRDGRSVVGTRRDGSVGGVKHVGDDTGLGENTGVFQVAVGDIPIAVLP